MEFSDILEAQKRLAGIAEHTPLKLSSTFTRLCGSQIYLKCENLQKTGSFKIRGAYNKIAKAAESGKPPKGVIAASAGNHAQGVAYAAAKKGIRAVIVMPKNAPVAKINATRGYGAEVILKGDIYDDAYAAAVSLAAQQGLEFIHPFDDKDIMAGQATTALEILKELPDADTIIIPAGGGGLLSGMAFAAKHLNPKIKIIGAQTETADAIVQSFKTGRHVALESAATIADGIAVKNPGALPLSYINKYADEMVTVTDDDVAAAIMLLLERSKMAVEPAGAVSVAAALSCKLAPNKNGKKTVCVLSGGNIDVSLMATLLERGLFARGRIMEFSVILSSRPDAFSRFARHLLDNNALIISMNYERAAKHLGLNESRMRVTLEVGGKEHGGQVIEFLKQRGYKVAPLAGGSLSVSKPRP